MCLCVCTDYLYFSNAKVYIPHDTQDAWAEKTSKIWVWFLNTGGSDLQTLSIKHDLFVPTEQVHKSTKIAIKFATKIRKIGFKFLIEYLIVK